MTVEGCSRVAKYILVGFNVLVLVSNSRVFMLCFLVCIHSSCLRYSGAVRLKNWTRSVSRDVSLSWANFFIFIKDADAAALSLLSNLSSVKLGRSLFLSCAVSNLRTPFTILLLFLLIMAAMYPSFYIFPNFVTV